VPPAEKEVAMRIAANRRNSKGFSLVELLAVIAIILILAVLTTPNILRAVRTYRLTSASREVASLLQRARYDAVRLNRRCWCVRRPSAARLPSG
jgi:type IV fimbrial biogenesis protein FimT